MSIYMYIYIYIHIRMYVCMYVYMYVTTMALPMPWVIIHLFSCVALCYIFKLECNISTTESFPPMPWQCFCLLRNLQMYFIYKVTRLEALAFTLVPFAPSF